MTRVLAIDHEEWKPIPDTCAYEISSLGRVRNSAGRMMKPCPHPRTGHLYVSFNMLEGPRKRKQIHRLVLFAFVGPPPSLNHESLHLDGDPRNNLPSNLCWGTRIENMTDRLRLTGKMSGDVLTTTEADEIRSRFTGAYGCQSKLAREYDVSRSVVNDLVNGRTYLWR